MPSSHVQTSAARKAASSQQATLDALVVIACDHLKEQLGAMGESIAAALADLTQHDADARAVYRRVKSARLLRDNAYAFHHLAGEALERKLRHELARLAPRPDAATPAEPLSLIPLAAIDDKLALDVLARPFDIAHADALATLAVRLGLLLGRGVLRADSNPFRPAVFLDALGTAWREFEPDAEAHGLLAPLLNPAIVFDFAPLFDALSAALRSGGQPGSVDALRIQKTDDVAAAKAARAGQRAALAEQLRQLFGDDGGDDGVPLIPELPALAAGIGGWRPSAATGFLKASAAGRVAPASPGADGADGGAVAGVGMGDDAGPGARADRSGPGVRAAGGFVAAVAGRAAHAGHATAPNDSGDRMHVDAGPQGGSGDYAGAHSHAAGSDAAPSGHGGVARMDAGGSGAHGIDAGATSAPAGGAGAPHRGTPYAAPGFAAAAGVASASASGGFAGPGADGGVDNPSGNGGYANPSANGGFGGPGANGGFSSPGASGGFGGAAAGVANIPHDAAPAAWPATLSGLLARRGGVAPLLDLLAGIEPILVQAGAAAGTPADAQPNLHADAHANPHAGAHAGAAPPAPDGFYLPRLQQSLPKGSLPRGDARTLDLLARVFETVLLDDSMPARARDLLHVLQVPVLKAALLDKTFFFEEAHPARRLVDLLSRMGWEQRQDADDPLFQAMRASVAQVAHVEDAHRPAAFVSAVADLEASIAAEESAQDAALAAPVASALRQEQLDVAGRAAREAIALRVQSGEVADMVGGFLEQRWSTVLTFAFTIEDARPGAVGNATRAMDDLIWSVKPKATQEQRKALIGRLPRLLATLNKWLDAIKWQDAERLQFFARLAECHASIVRAPIELAPERQLELAVEAAQRDALLRVEMENAAAQRQAAHALEVSAVDGLERGMWLEFGTADGARKVKLAWVSPLRTLFIFSGAARREAFSMAADKLAAALHDGSARVLAIDGVVGQVLSEAMARGAVNDGAMATLRLAV